MWQKPSKCRKLSPERKITPIDLDEQDGLLNSQMDSNYYIGLFNELIKRLDKSPHKAKLFAMLQFLLTYEPTADGGGDAVWKKIEEMTKNIEEAKIHQVLNQDTPADSTQSTVLKSSPSSESVLIEGDDIPKIVAPPSPRMPPPPPPPSPSNSCTPSPYPGAMSSTTEELLPQQSPPNPNIKMKTLYWDTISSSTILGRTNIWTLMANQHKKSFRLPIEWHKAESLFSVQSAGTLDTQDKSTIKRNAVKQNKLLNDQRSFLIEILLEQFKGLETDDDIIELVRSAKHQAMGSEKIKRLLKLLPEMDELDVIRNFKGNRDELVRAEKFLLKLIEIPDYKLRLECMAFKEDFNENFEQLNASIKTVIQSGNEILNNKALHEILYIIVLVGNFLNTGKSGGNAVGIKLSSLSKLSQTRANADGMNFLHFLVDQIKKSQPQLLKFSNEFPKLHEVNKINLEQLPIDIKKFENRLQNLKSQLNVENTMPDINEHMTQLLQTDESQINQLKTGLNDVEAMRLKLSAFFCEPSASFKLKDCFKTFNTFISDFKRTENELERMEANALRKQIQSYTYGTMKPITKEKANLGVHNRFNTVKTKTKINNGFIKEAIENEHRNRDKGKMDNSLSTLGIKNDENKTEVNTKLYINNKAKNETLKRETNDKGLGSSEGTQIENNKTELNTKVNIKQNDELNISVSERIRLFSNITKSPHSTPLLSKRNPPNIATKQKSIPNIPKYDKIGVRVMPINERSLREVIKNLKPVPKTNSLWNIPRERLLRNQIHNNNNNSSNVHGGISENKRKFFEKNKLQEDVLRDNEKKREEKLKIKTSMESNHRSTTVGTKNLNRTSITAENDENATEISDSGIKNINATSAAQSDNETTLTNTSFPKRIINSIVKGFGFMKK
ncbi:uncharacterized protein [Musca autumnalis]|uniref:uncharacterized protein n=1 Tax=Musca autumnalis TaxID=221902 RepID=UPI003CF16E90